MFWWLLFHKVDRRKPVVRSPITYIGPLLTTINIRYTPTLPGYAFRGREQQEHDAGKIGESQKAPLASRQPAERPKHPGIDDDEKGHEEWDHFSET